MRKSILILALLISGTTYTCYSQKLSEPLLKEINLRIAEGIECKQLLEEKSNQVSILQNLSKEQTAKAENLSKQVILLTENNTISEIGLRKVEAILNGFGYELTAVPRRSTRPTLDTLKKVNFHG